MLHDVTSQSENQVGKHQHQLHIIRVCVFSACKLNVCRVVWEWSQYISNHCGVGQIGGVIIDELKLWSDMRGGG